MLVRIEMCIFHLIAVGVLYRGFIRRTVARASACYEHPGDHFSLTSMDRFECGLLFVARFDKHSESYATVRDTAACFRSQ